MKMSQFPIQFFMHRQLPKMSLRRPNNFMYLKAKAFNRSLRNLLHRLISPRLRWLLKTNNHRLMEWPLMIRKDTHPMAMTHKGSQTTQTTPTTCKTTVRWRSLRLALIRKTSQLRKLRNKNLQLLTFRLRIMLRLRITIS